LGPREGLKSDFLSPREAPLARACQDPENPDFGPPGPRRPENPKKGSRDHPYVLASPFRKHEKNVFFLIEKTMILPLNQRSEKSESAQKVL